MTLSDRWIEWRMDWLPYRVDEWIGPDNLNSAGFFDDRNWSHSHWCAPRRGPFGWLMRGVSA